MDALLAVVGGVGALAGIIGVVWLAVKLSDKGDKLDAVTLQLATTQTDAASKASTITTLQAQVGRLQEVDDALEAEAAKLVATPSDPHGAFDRLLSKWRADRAAAATANGTGASAVHLGGAAVGATAATGPGDALLPPGS